MKKTTQITPAELDAMINEEATKFRKALLIQKEIEEINSQLNEVRVGGEMDSEIDGGVHAGQRKPIFTAKPENPHMKMEDDAADEDSDADIDDASKEDDEKTQVFQAIEDLKNALENILGKDEEEEEKEEGGENEEDAETFEFDVDDSDEDKEELNDEEEKEEESDDEVTEGLDEPIKGGSAVQVAKEDDVNDNMKKDTHVDAEGTNLLESEKKRMAHLAGIIKG